MSQFGQLQPFATVCSQAGQHRMLDAAAMGETMGITSMFWNEASDRLS